MCTWEGLAQYSITRSAPPCARRHQMSNPYRRLMHALPSPPRSAHPPSRPPARRLSATPQFSRAQMVNIGLRPYTGFISSRYVDMISVMRWT
jgi:hypothetical protein